MPDDAFSRLGLPRRFQLDAADLERRYLTQSRAVHPDYHASGTAADLAASLDLSAAVNAAYSVLRDPFTRAEHLLGLEGGPTAGEHKQTPPGFLAEMLDLREQVEEARTAGAHEAPAVSALGAEFTARIAGLMDQVARLFAEYELLPADDPKRAGIRGQIRSLLNAATYLRGLSRDLNAD